MSIKRIKNIIDKPKVAITLLSITLNVFVYAILILIVSSAHQSIPREETIGTAMIAIMFFFGGFPVASFIAGIIMQARFKQRHKCTLSSAFLIGISTVFAFVFYNVTAGHMNFSEEIIMHTARILIPYIIGVGITKFMQIFEYKQPTANVE